MPDNEFAALAAEMGFTPAAQDTPPADGTAATEDTNTAGSAATETDTSATATQTEGASTEGQTTEDDKPATKAGETDPAKTQTQDKASHAFAEMRTKLAQFEKPLQRAAAAVGMSVEDFLASLEDKAMNKQAAAQGVPKEILQRLEVAEERSRAFEFETTKQRVQTSLMDLKNDLKLNENEMQRFVKDCISSQVDLTQPNVDMKGLYRGMYFEELIEKQRQEWIIKDATNKGSASTPSGVQGRGTGKPNLVESDAQLSDILSKL